MVKVVSLIILFGGALSMYLALAQLFAKNRTIPHYIMALLLICLGIFQIRGYLVISGIAVEHPAFFIVALPVFYAIGPLLYFYFQTLLNSRFRITLKKSLHFLPALLLLVLEITVIMLTSFDSAIEKRITVLTEFFLPEQSPITVMIKYNMYGAIFFNLLYQITIIRNTLNLYRFMEMDFMKRSLFLVISVSVLAPLSFFVFLYTESMIFLVSGISIITFLIIFTHILFQRELDLLEHLTTDMRRKKYERSLLSGVDVDIVHRRLVELMEEEKIYSDYDITLQKLAEYLLITQHQLSEFLNEKLEMNFSSFINRYRINEAKELLLSNTDLSILQIAYSVGFNSKSAFNTAFQKFTGTTPLNYRKKDS